LLLLLQYGLLLLLQQLVLLPLLLLLLLCVLVVVQVLIQLAADLRELGFEACFALLQQNLGVCRSSRKSD
jgi:hypothetical protein